MTKENDDELFLGPDDKLYKRILSRPVSNKLPSFMKSKEEKELDKKLALLTEDEMMEIFNKALGDTKWVDEFSEDPPLKYHMRNPERIDELLDLIRTYWKKYPDTRFHQLIHNLQAMYHAETGKGIKKIVDGVANYDLYNLEDDVFILWLKKRIGESK